MQHASGQIPEVQMGDMATPYSDELEENHVDPNVNNRRSKLNVTSGMPNWNKMSFRGPWISRIKFWRRGFTYPPNYELQPTLEVGSRRSSSKRRRSQHLLCKSCSGCLTISFAIFGFYCLVSILIRTSPFTKDRSKDQFMPDWGKPGHAGENISHYPTDFTRDVLPVPCHSHNDYWRRIPLFDAIHYGCIGVEADVWSLGDDELYVGHNRASLSKNRTFRSLYVDPLVRILDRQNPSTSFDKASGHGVFDEVPEQTLVLLVDFKTRSSVTFPRVLSQLTALRGKNHLSYFDGSVVHYGPITVVATGNTDFNDVIANSTYRDIFFDAPLQEFSVSNPTISSSKYDSTNSYYASTSLSEVVGIPWLGHYSDSQIQKLKDQIQGAQRVGLKARYWETPGWPIGMRNYVWGMLVKAGVDYLNVDDLRSVVEGRWGGWGK